MRRTKMLEILSGYAAVRQLYTLCVSVCIHTYIHTNTHTHTFEVGSHVAHLQSLYVVKDDFELLFLLLLPSKYQYYRYTPSQSFHTKHQL